MFGSNFLLQNKKNIHIYILANADLFQLDFCLLDHPKKLVYAVCIYQEYLQYQRIVLGDLTDKKSAGLRSDERGDHESGQHWRTCVWSFSHVSERQIYPKFVKVFLNPPV